MTPLHKMDAGPDTAIAPLEIVEGGLAVRRAGGPWSKNLPSSLLPLAKRLLRALPAGLPMWIYTTLLSPPPLRRWVNALLLRMIPDQVQVNGVTVALNPADPVVSSALTLGVYETFETKLIARLVCPGMRVLDVGANVGYYTALLAKQVGPQGFVTAFEPEPGNFRALSRTLRANNFHNVQAVAGAVAQAPGESLLFLSEMNGGDHRLYATEGRAGITVPLYSIDSFLSPDTVVDFIKMDIQGSEGLALRGMRETLRRSPSVQILTEFWPQGLAQAGVPPQEFLHTLQNELGFHLWEVDETHERLLAVTPSDLIARHSGRRYTNLYCTRSAALL